MEICYLYKSLAKGIEFKSILQNDFYNVVEKHPLQNGIGSVYRCAALNYFHLLIAFSHFAISFRKSYSLVGWAGVVILASVCFQKNCFGVLCQFSCPIKVASQKRIAFENYLWFVNRVFKPFILPDREIL